MYKKAEMQISLSEFYSPLGKVDPTNRWVQIADIIPWDKYEKEYAKQFCPNNGAPATPFRMALGTLIIKQQTGHSDEDVIQDILENPYIQYLIGLHEFTTKAPFSQAAVTYFRKYIPNEMLKEINNELFRHQPPQDKDNDGNNGGTSGGGAGNENSSETPPPENKGELLLDATCAPADITYPTDLGLLNEAREKLEGIIDTLHPHTGWTQKPRTYREKARKRFLSFIKKRKHSRQDIRKAIGQQLRYVKRDLRHVEIQLIKAAIGKLTKTQHQWLDTIRKIYKQQRRMYDTKTHTIEDRIVSITQPHVRPIVRGKKNAETEFGAKVSISMKDGYAFIEKLDWDAYNESGTLIPALESYKASYGYYPEAVLADKIYRNRENLRYCNARGIRLSGPRLGRPPANVPPETIRQDRQDAARRNAVEGKFGEGKTKYGLDRIMARLKDTSETVIALAFLCMNLNRWRRIFLFLFFDSVKYPFCVFSFC